MRALAIGAAVAALAFTAVAYAQTLMGNCVGGLVGVDQPTGNVYCTVPTCTPTGLDFTNACDSQYIIII